MPQSVRTCGCVYDAGVPGEAACDRESRARLKVPRHPSRNQLPMAIPASSAIAQQLPNSCPTVVDKLPRERAHKAQPRSKSAVLGHIRAPISSNCGQHWPLWAKSWPNRPILALTANSGRIWPDLVKLRQAFADIGQDLARIDQLRPNSEDTWPNTARLGRVWAAYRLPGGPIGRQPLDN